MDVYLFDIFSITADIEQHLNKTNASYLANSSDDPCQSIVIQDTAIRFYSGVNEDMYVFWISISCVFDRNIYFVSWLLSYTIQVCYSS